jgi:hypothetical protein
LTISLVGEREGVGLRESGHDLTRPTHAVRRGLNPRDRGARVKGFVDRGVVPGFECAREIYVVVVIAFQAVRGDGLRGDGVVVLVADFNVAARWCGWLHTPDEERQ